MHTRPDTQKRDKGFALLLVLWTMALLSLIATQVIIAGKASMRLSAAIRNTGQARSQADAAIQTAIFHLLSDGDRHWPPDGHWHTIEEPDLHAAVRLTAETDKLNPNIASLALLTNVLIAAGAPSSDATALAQEIVSLRSPQLPSGTPIKTLSCRVAGQPFHTLDDLGTTPGMTPAILTRLAPHLSFTQTIEPVPQSHDPLIQAAFAQLVNHSAQPADSASLDEKIEEISIVIESQANVPGGISVARHATILTRPDRDMPFQILTWGSVSAGSLSSRF